MFYNGKVIFGFAGSVSDAFTLSERFEEMLNKKLESEAIDISLPSTKVISGAPNMLEELVEQYPTYFYDILPYAYALGVSSKYAKNFEGIAMQPPSYYNGTDLNVIAFTAGLSSSMSSSSSGGGSFSGGGGGGGGGGGSW